MKILPNKLDKYEKWKRSFYKELEDREFHHILKEGYVKSWSDKYTPQYAAKKYLFHYKGKYIE